MFKTPMATLLAALIAATLASVAAAQTTTAPPATRTATAPAAPPTESQIERERARIDAQRKAMFSKTLPGKRATDGQALPGTTAIEREASKVQIERKQMFATDKLDTDKRGTRSAPNNFPRFDTPARSDIDIQALAKRYEGKANARKRDGLMVFASFAMPKESLKRAVAEANRAGGVVVMRGFKDGSIKATSKAISELGQASGTVQINPKAFTKYRIERVPAVVLAKPGAGQVLGEDGCALPSDYAMVYGDVALAYALEQIERSAPAFGAMAVRYARPLRGTVQ